jgi:predicted small secreted protein
MGVIMKLRKTMALLAALGLSVAILGGCGNSAADNTGNDISDGGTPIEETDMGVTVSTPDDPALSITPIDGGADDTQSGDRSPDDPSTGQPTADPLVDQSVNDPSADPPVTTFSEAAPTNDNGATVNGDQLIDGASLNGMVAGFDENGCSVRPVVLVEEGVSEVTKTDLPIEAEELLIDVTYQSDCVFQSAHFNQSTGTAALSAASKEDINENTSVLLFGEYQDADHLNVSKVVIARY